MALTMLDKQAEKKDKSQWPADIAAEFERESKNPNPCVGSTLLSENERTRVWIIRLAPGERIGFHRHVLDYFWTSVSGGRGRQHVHDGTTVEYTYQPGETRHESYGKGPRSRESRRPRNGFHDCRVQGQRQQADDAACGRTATIRRSLTSTISVTPAVGSSPRRASYLSRLQRFG
jgi:quercetin dioxygenase-like cupin family protein